MNRELVRFGLVGVSATLVHYTSAVAFMWLGGAPRPANVFAFMLAFQFSFWCHYNWSFGSSGVSKRVAFMRFAAISVGAFLVNHAVFSMVIERAAVRPEVVLALVLALTAGVTFMFGKYWVFVARR